MQGQAHPPATTGLAVAAAVSLGQNIILDREIFSKLYEIISVFFKVRPFVEIFVSRLIMIPKLLAFFQCILQSKKFKSI